MLVKQIGATTLGLINLALLVRAVLAHRRRQSAPPAVYSLQAASVCVAVLQLAVGVYFVLEGRVVNGRHLFYGILVGVGVLAQAALWSRTTLGQRYRGKPLVHAFFGLLVMLAALRSWMSA